jgi:hypothetical protein
MHFLRRWAAFYHSGDIKYCSIRDMGLEIGREQMVLSRISSKTSLGDYIEIPEDCVAERWPDSNTIEESCIEICALDIRLHNRN